MRDILARLSRYEVWKFDREFDTQRGPVRSGINSFVESPHKNYLNRCISVKDEAMNRCFDKRGRCYPNSFITEWAWEFIEQANGKRENLYQLLFPLGKAELYRFHQEFEGAVGLFLDDTFLDNLNYPWEDSAAAICGWVVSHGKEYYYQVWNNPDLMPWIELDEPDNLEGVVDKVYEKKFGGDIWDYDY